MKINCKLVAISLATVSLVACSAKELSTADNAHKVIVSHKRPAENCKFIGQVTGNQGNFFTGGWTSNRNLELGAMNDLRNQAAKIKANYVEVITNRASSTGGMSDGSGGMQQTGSILMGNAYFCPNLNIEN